MRKFLLSLFLIISSYSFGQVKEYPIHLTMLMNTNDIPPSDVFKMPYFFSLILSDTVNIEKVDEAFFEFQEEEKKDFIKNIKKNGGKLNEVEENPYERFFILWRSRVDMFINEQKIIDHSKIINYSKKFSKNINDSSNKSMVAANWNPIGNYDIVNQNLIKIPWVQNIYYIDVYENDTNYMYCVTESGLLFRTTNKGANWEYKRPSRGPVVMDPTNFNKIYTVRNNILIVSEDGGTTSNPSYNYNFGASCTEIIICKTNPNLIFAACSNGLYKSSDAGLNWIKVINDNVTDVEFKSGSCTDVFAISYTGKFYKSTDSGTSFTSNTIIPTLNSIGGLIAVTPSNPNSVYISFLNAGLGGLIIYKSTDLGVNFQQKGAFAQDVSIIGQGFYDFVLQASPSNENHLFFGTTSGYRSSDSGVTSTKVCGYGGNHVTHPDLQDVVAIGSETFLATDGGIVLNTDFFNPATGVNTTSISNGLWSVDFWGFGHSWNEDLWGGGKYHCGNSVQREGWPHGLHMGGAESPTGVYIEPLGIAFNDINGGKLLKIPTSLPAPSTFSASYSFTGHPNVFYYGTRIASVVQNPNYFNVVYTAKDNSINYSLDFGANFKIMKDFGKKTWDIKIARSNTNVIYAVVNGNGNQLFKTTDANLLEFATWQQIAVPLSGNIYVEVDEFDENIVFVYNNNSIYKSTNGGTSWVNISPSGSFTIKSIIKHIGVSEGLYVFLYNNLTNNTEVKYKDATLSSWVDYSDGLIKDFNINRLKPFIYYGKNKLRFGSGGAGVWETPLYNTNYTPVAQPTSNSFPFSCINKNIMLDSFSAVDQTNVSWMWTFSEAPSIINSNTIRNPIVQFSSPGIKTATLNVTDNNTGLSNSKSITIDVRGDSNDLVINSIPSPSGDNIFYGKNVTLNTSIPLTAKVYIYFSETFTIPDQLFEGLGNIHAEKIITNNCN